MRPALLRQARYATAALCTALMLCLNPAAADERSDAVDTIITTVPLTCANAAYARVLQTAVRKTAEMAMLALNISLNLNGTKQNPDAPNPLDSWQSGGPDYDKAYALLLAAAGEDERRAGPVLPQVSGTAFIREILATMPTAALQAYAAFVTGPQDRVNWLPTTDLWACLQLEDGIGTGPDAGPSSDTMWTTRHAYDKDWQAHHVELSAAEKQALTERTSAILTALLNGIDARVHSAQRKARAAQIVRVHAVELRALAQDYMNAPRN